jgi:hypothetical protein
MDMGRVRKKIGQMSDELGREVFIKEQLHWIQKLFYALDLLRMRGTRGYPLR